MNNFKCEKCGTPIMDSPEGYITWCKHYPKEQPAKIADDKFLDWLDEQTKQQVKERREIVKRIMKKLKIQQSHRPELSQKAAPARLLR